MYIQYPCKIEILENCKSNISFVKLVYLLGAQYVPKFRGSRIYIYMYSAYCEYWVQLCKKSLFCTCVLRKVNVLNVRVQCTVYRVQSIVQCAVRSTMYSTKYNVQYTMQCTVHSTMYSKRVYSIHRVQCIVHSPIYSIQCSVQYTDYCTVQNVL